MVLRDASASKKIHSRNSGRESEASILGNDREREFPLTPDLSIISISISIFEVADAGWDGNTDIRQVKLEYVENHRKLFVSLNMTMAMFMKTTTNHPFQQ